MEIDTRTDRSEVEIPIPAELPVIPSGDSVIYPSMIVPMAVTDEKIIKLVDEAIAGNKMVGLFARRADSREPLPQNLYQIGTAAGILRMFRMPDGSIRVFLQGICRIRMKEVIQTEPYVKVSVEKIEEIEEKTPELQAVAQAVLSSFQKIVSLAPNLPNELSIAAMNLPTAGSLADFVAAHININLQEAQELLEEADVKKRLEKLMKYVTRELEILELRGKIQSQVQTVMDKTQREFYLREQLKAIQRELGELDERTMEINELKARIEAAGMPEEVRKEAERELDRLAKMPPQAAEYTTSRTYLDWLISLPWSKSTEDNLDINQARKILDEDHYDLEKVKERIIDYLAVRKLRQDMKGPILCFVGPPGVGKTSIGRSIARALG
ncbi:MAG: LON peptidase substrate-binding domain-containing protein, partial [Dehalococcoidales bacterium]|nr:LON peptidase substrate-binding domain-containing protein [Dehalococcoidales bacterium]